MKLILALVGILSLVLAGCSDDDIGKLAGEIKPNDCPPSAQIGDRCGGGTVFENNYLGTGIILISFEADTPSNPPGAMYKTTNDSSAPAGDFNDGRNNTGTFNAAHPASYTCQSHVKEGFSDWYLPSVNEMLNLQNVINVLLFVPPGIDPGGEYHTSTEDIPAQSWAVDLTGGPTSNSKTWPLPVHCIRRAG